MKGIGEDRCSGKGRYGNCGGKTAGTYGTMCTVAIRGGDGGLDRVKGVEIAGGVPTGGGTVTVVTVSTTFRMDVNSLI